MRNRKASDKKYRASKKGRVSNRAAQRAWRRRHPAEAKTRVAVLVRHGEAVQAAQAGEPGRRPPSFSETRNAIAREKFIAASKVELDGDEQTASRLRQEALAIRPTPPRIDHSQALAAPLTPMEEPLSSCAPDAADLLGVADWHE